jgi:hypothetical protein
MPDQVRLNNGNGPNAFGQDSPVWRMGHWLDRIGAAGSATEAETEWRTGSRAPFKDSRLNFPSWTGSRPWTGGDDMILTPFSLSHDWYCGRLVTCVVPGLLYDCRLQWHSIYWWPSCASGIRLRPCPLAYWLITPWPSASGMCPLPLVLKDNDPLIPITWHVYKSPCTLRRALSSTLSSNHIAPIHLTITVYLCNMASWSYWLSDTLNVNRHVVLQQKPRMIQVDKMVRVEP